MSVCPSVTSRCSTEKAKRRITQTTPHDSLGTLVFWCPKSWQMSNGVTPNGGAKCRWDRLNAGAVAANWRLSSPSVVNLVRSQVYHTERPLLFAVRLPWCSSSGDIDSEGSRGTNVCCLIYHSSIDRLLDELERSFPSRILDVRSWRPLLVLKLFDISSQYMHTISRSSYTHFGWLLVYVRVPHHVRKKRATLLLPLTVQNVNRFSKNSFTGKRSSKFLIKQ